jgi:hypothetical protein
MLKQTLKSHFQLLINAMSRKEWDPVGILGICRLLKGQQVAPSWIKMRDVSEQVEEWFVK